MKKSYKSPQYRVINVDNVNVMAASAQGVTFTGGGQGSAAVNNQSANSIGYDAPVLGHMNMWSFE